MNMSENDLKELEELGFEHTGEFFVNQGKVEFRLTRYRDDSGIYAFIALLSFFHSFIHIGSNATIK